MENWLVRAMTLLAYWAIRDYYTRFGFRPRAEFNLDNEYDAGDEFMALELHPGALDGVHGLVRFVREFMEVGA